MKLTSEALQDAYQAETTPSDRLACPSGDHLARAASPGASSQDRTLLGDHLTHCAACAREYRILRATHPDLARGREERVAPRAGGAWSWPSLRWAGVALAASATALLIIVALRSEEAPRPAVLRSQGTPRLGALVSEQVPLRRDRCLLRWSPAPAGSRYSLRMARADLTLVHEVTGLDAPQHLVPRAALANLPSGAELVWMVRAVLPDGRRWVSSVFRARLQ